MLRNGIGSPGSNSASESARRTSRAQVSQRTPFSRPWTRIQSRSPKKSIQLTPAGYSGASAVSRPRLSW